MPFSETRPAGPAAEEGTTVSTTGQAEAVHKHAFPCNPPGGTYLHPGPCECGKTCEQGEADQLLAMALAALERAYGVPPRVSTHWAVSCGSEDVNDGIGLVEHYDDEQDAREHLEQYAGGSVVRRTAIALRWEIVPGDVTFTFPRGTKVTVDRTGNVASEGTCPGGC